MDTTLWTLNLCWPTERKYEGGKAKKVGWTMRDRGYPISPLLGDSDATDEVGGGSWSWIVWPHSTCSQEKQAKTPVLDKGYHGNLSPFRQEISRESTESVRLCEYVCVCGYAWRYNKLLCHRYCLGHLWLRMNCLRGCTGLSFKGLLLVSVLVFPSENMWQNQSARKDQHSSTNTLSGYKQDSSGHDSS